jgi:hypothetical protein
MEIKLFCPGKGHFVDEVHMFLYPFAVHIEKLINREYVLLTVVLAQISETCLSSLLLRVI